ncbi:MAG: hypothetical protein F6K41_14250 [Symploca sp. SIO3E6]|nr:hypothetical protein [Caldora sp. SIO3E6]
MSTATVTLEIPEQLYQRLVNTAQATQRPLAEILLRSLQVGSPPAWDDVPDEFQAELAALDKLDDNTLWEIARGQKTVAEMKRYDLLLAKNQNGSLTAAEKWELLDLRKKADLYMLSKAQAAVLLRWRGHKLPSKI